jgi:hypothetical protein
MSIKSCLASVALVLTAVTAPTATSRAECSFENAVIIQSAWAAASLDAKLSGNTPQAQQAAQREFDGVLSLAPRPCTDEMIANSSSELPNLCANNVAWPVMMQSLDSIAANYRATSNWEAFKSRVLATVNQYMMSLPRQCWLVQIQLETQRDCRLLQQQFAACEAQAHKAPIKGANLRRINNKGAFVHGRRHQPNPPSFA